MRHLEAKIVLELDAVHDGEHRGRGCAAHKEHLRWCNRCGWRRSWWGSAQCGWWCRRSSPQWRWERAQASSPQGSAEISWEANWTNFARIVRVTYRDGQLIRQKVEVDKWNGCGWLMSTCGLKLFERRHEVMLLEDFPVNSPETRVIRVRAMLIQDISEIWKQMFRHPVEIAIIERKPFRNPHLVLIFVRLPKRWDSE